MLHSAHSIPAPSRPCAPSPLWARLSMLDCIYMLLLATVALVAYERLGSYMDAYEQGILVGATAAFGWLGWYWKPMRWFLPLCGALALVGIGQYHGQLDQAEHRFLLKYFLASQTAVMWMCTLYPLAALLHWGGLLRNARTVQGIANGLCWAGCVAAGTWYLVRWYESYLLGTDIGHIPESNLYEVFILFSLITTLLYLHFAAKLDTPQLGAFVMSLVTALVGFILWYGIARQAHEIQPLIPALQSWWMKLHVPANFIGYGCFALAATLGIAQLLVMHGRLAGRLPDADTIGEVMYKAIAVGFLFFTIATLLGAMWAADAWGGYWSWDPKETWALIVWLNYAAWLHVRMVKGWRGAVLAWWAVIGLFVTAFAFLGVNMFLSGLHSYGSL